MTNAEIQIEGESKQLVSVTKDKKERRLRREIVETISNWIPEHKTNSRAEEIAAIRRFFDSEQPLSKI